MMMMMMKADNDLILQNLMKHMDHLFFQNQFLFATTLKMFLFGMEQRCKKLTYL